LIRLVLCCCCVDGAALAAQTPLLEDAEPQLVGRAGVEAGWQAEAARIALHSGLAATAADLYAALLADVDFGAEERIQLMLDYVAALIAQARYQKASDTLLEVPGQQQASRRQLYRASILYGLAGDAQAAAMGAALSEVDAASLSSVDVPWYYFLRGFDADVAGDSSRAEDYYALAEGAAASSMQAAQFSSLVLRQQLLKSKTDGNLLVEIRAKYEALRGEAVVFPFLLEYVVLLHREDRALEAIGILDTEIADSQVAYSPEQRANLLLLKSLILGPESSAGWSALQDLVRAGIDSDSTIMALQLMAAVPEGGPALMALLNEIIDGSATHPLLAELHYMRCQLALTDPARTEQAEADARYLLEQFPGLAEIGSVYQLLAFAAIQRDPPRYRVAADYLLDLRERTAEPEPIARLNRLIGDCYFLNRDYSNAADFYELARAGLAAGAARSSVLLRLVISQIRSGKIPAALALIDQADRSGLMGEGDRWQVEWSIALALQAGGQEEQALERLRFLIGQNTSSVPTLLDLRLRWLEAYISLKLGDSAAIPDKVEVLLTRIDSMPDTALDPVESARLKSELLLLQSESMFALDDVESAFAVIARIRQDFSKNTAAKRTYFTEAAYRASVNEPGQAKQVLLLFARDYPGSSLVPQALFEAALHAQRQGPEHFGEAVVLLDQLVQDFPASDIVYYAGLKQGDLLRLMNNFAGAQLIYENLINRFPAHRLRYAAELSRADCIAALAQSGGGQVVEALSILERLVDQPDLPLEVQIEAAYKWGRILLRNNEYSQAKTVLGLTTSRYLLDSTYATSLTGIGRYWLSRAIFALGGLLEREGDPQEAVKLYRKLVAFNLPGRSLALARITQLQAGGNL